MYCSNNQFFFDEEHEGKQQVGTLTKEQADLIRNNLDSSFSLNECDILIGSNNIEHIKNKHEDEFNNYNQHISEILSSPDYIGLHPNKKSIEFIKQLDINILIAVRIKNKNPLWMKSFFEISSKKLQNYIANGRIIKVCNSLNEVASTK